MAKVITKTTVRENAKQVKLADKVVRTLSKQEGRRVSKSSAYLIAMEILAFKAG